LAPARDISIGERLGWKLGFWFNVLLKAVALHDRFNGAYGARQPVIAYVYCHFVLVGKH
jgi:hypothetical protein